MAKRYFTFAELSEKPTGVELRAGGTLGRHHFIVDYKSETRIKVSGFNTDGSKACETTIKAGGSLGYNCGSVWAIKPQSDMTPLELLRSEFRIPKTNVFFVSKSEMAEIELDELQSAISKDSPHANRNRFWGNGETWGFTGKFSAFTERHSFRGGVDQRRQIGRVFILAKDAEKGISECYEALCKYSGKSFTNIKHPANGLLFAP